MAPIAFPHGEHPDGDPFAEADKQRNSNSLLGRLEAQALAEQAQQEKAAAQQQGTPSNRAAVPPPTRSASLRSSRSTTSAAASTKKAEKLETVIIGDSDEDSQEAKEVALQMVAGNGRRSAPVSAGKANGKGVSTRKHAREETQEDIVMVDADKPEAQRARTKSPTPQAEPSVVEAAPKSAVKTLTRADSSNSLSSLPSSRATSPVVQNLPAPAPPSASRVPSIDALLSHPLPSANEPTKAASPSEPIEVPVAVPASHQVHAPVPARRAKSPPVAPLPKPKRVSKTIRLEITLPAPGTAEEVPQHNIDELAKDAGYMDEPEPEAEDEEKDGSNTEGEDGDSDESDGEGGKKKKEQDQADGKEKGDDKMEGVETAAGPSGEATASAGGDAAAAPVKRRKRGPNVVQGRHGGYDTEDPFVDDTELDLYEPKHYVPALRPGFFVCTGDVEVETKKNRGRVAGSKNKPKYDENGNVIPATRKAKGAAGDPPTPGASTSAARGGAKGSAPPTPRLDDDLPSVSSLPAFGSTGPLPPVSKASAKKPERTGPHSFSPELQAEIDMLKAEINKESFEVKGKFPPRLRPILIEVAQKALDLGEYDDDFFAILPKLFPYNLFTMKKLVKREIFAYRISTMTAAQDEHIDIIRRGVNETLARQKKEFEEAHATWAVEKAKFDAGVSASRQTSPETPAIGAVAPLAAIAGTPGSSKAGEVGTSPGPGGKDDDGGPTEPKFKFRFTEPMRFAILNAVELDDEMSALFTEKQELEKGVEKGEKPFSGMNARKNLYSKISTLWPTGDMTTNQLSREMSAAKAKRNKHIEA
ncbi:hypothetical protein BCR35DRAFT_204914 [Leucosporidium creatinivorum]|uniref:Ubinuclein middle domain-containing protein n=1 Tax=Leucosporidium creatinivorum TaxID=106004 RepID=A0A1Y2FYY1_9BASI|nr:hypothetical protein BCR35DRAFT_204914 [Leucosporidium creatinivorum]